jgi:hypothetical protein
LLLKVVLIHAALDRMMGEEYALWSSRTGSLAARDTQTRSVLEQLIEALSDSGEIHAATAAMVTAHSRALLAALPATGRVRGSAFNGRLTVIDEIPPGLGRGHRVHLL